MLTPKQIEELNIASARKASGKASREDFLNIEYAKDKFGYSYTPPVTQPLTQTQTNMPLPPAPTSMPANIPTPETIYGDFNAPEGSFISPEQTAIEQQYADYLKGLTAPIDEDKIRRDTLAQFQAQIDATNALYAQQLAEAQRQGQGRLGEAGAIQARRGLLGSDFGAAQTENVRGYNTAIERNIQAEQNAAIQAILSEGRNDATAEIRRRREALQGGYESYIEYLKGASERKQNNATKAATALIAQGLDLASVNPQDLQKLAEYYGISVNDIKSVYDQVQQETVQAQTDAELDRRKKLAEIGKLEADAQGKPITLSPGQSIFDAQGNFLGTAPSVEELQPYDTVTVDGSVYVFDPNTGGLTLQVQGTTEDEPPKVVDINGVDSIYNPTTGQYEPVNVTQSQSPVRYQEQVDNANSILNSKALDSAVGPTFLTRGLGAPIDKLTGTQRKFLGDVENLISQVTLDKLIEVKGEGATFGALSDQERVELQNAATPLNRWAIRDESGRITGFDVRESDFRKEIERLRDKAQTKIVSQPPSGVPSNYIRVRDKASGESGWIDPVEYNDQQYEKISFSGVGGDTKLATTPYLKTLGKITGEGSPLWRWGLDVDLKKGDPVKSPISGTIIATNTNGGFGRQVRIKGDDGREYWLSHLDGYSVRPGQRIGVGQLIGLGGNTGRVISGKGGDGSHLDITVKGADGKYIPPKEVKKLLNNVFV